MCIHVHTHSHISTRKEGWRDICVHERIDEAIAASSLSFCIWGGAEGSLASHHNRRHCPRLLLLPALVPQACMFCKNACSNTRRQKLNKRQQNKKVWIIWNYLRKASMRVSLHASSRKWKWMCSRALTILSSLRLSFCTYICIYTYIHVYIYICIHREREREVEET